MSIIGNPLRLLTSSKVMTQIAAIGGLTLGWMAYNQTNNLKKEIAGLKLTQSPQCDQFTKITNN